MAVREHQVEIYRGHQRQDRFRAQVDLDRGETLQHVLHSWLERNRIDPRLWEDEGWKIHVLAPARLVEVAA